MHDMLQLAAEVIGPSFKNIRVLHQIHSDAVNNPRSGLRRWVIRSNHYSTDPHELIDWAAVELHHDGSIALAIALAGFVPKGPFDEAEVRQVPSRLVDALMAESVALAASHVRSFGGVGTTLIRAQFLRNKDDQTPLVAVDNRLGGGYASGSFHQVAGSRAVRRVVPVEAQFSAEDDVAVCGYPCQDCGEPFCPACGKCRCLRAAAREQRCSKCTLSYQPHLLVDGLCVGCRE